MLYGSPQGYEPLRREIAEWLLLVRGMEVPPENIFITSGATQAIHLAVETLRRSGMAFAVEDPCHWGVTRLLNLRGIPFHGVPVDEHGLQVDKLPDANIAGVYVTPSHQFPLGCVLAASRRSALAAVAGKRGFHIIEDDYDSDLRYVGQPLTPLWTLYPERVIYVGTFSKTVFPALRIGYAVMPPPLHAAWLEQRRYVDIQNPVTEQAVLAEFMHQGRLRRHLQTMTRLYGKKRQTLLAAVSAHFGEQAEILGDGAGLHLALRLRKRDFDDVFVRRCREAGLFLSTCAAYEVGTTQHRDTLLLGYGAIPEGAIGSGIEALYGMTSAR